MFDLFKSEIKNGFKVKLYLTTGKEIEGVVIEINDNSVVLQSTDLSKNRFFDKIIGGWEIIKKRDERQVAISNEFPKPESQLVTQSSIDKHHHNKDVKYIEKEINNLIRDSKFEQALERIKIELDRKNLENKYRSSLLLKKAQIYSSLNKADESELAYKMLISFNEKIKSPANNLSHLYTELARLQGLKSNNLENAIDSINKALRYNPSNNFAKNLLRQIEIRSGKIINIDPGIEESGQLIIEASEETNTISRLIDIDIKEHKFIHPEIIKNNGKPSAFIAKQILEEAKSTKDVELSERYPIYLEAAKAFSNLNVGSYSLQDYQEAVSYYSVLKGNSIFLSFRNKVNSGEIDRLDLVRLKDSACSYYLETLNILSNINPNLLLGILANYLKLNIVIYCVENKTEVEFVPLFKGQFSDVFSFCLSNNNKEIEKIAYKTIIDCGASSISAWNTLSSLPKGTGILYGYLEGEKKSKEIFSLINDIENSDIDIELKPGPFFKSVFENRRMQINLLVQDVSELLSISFDPYSFEAIKKIWERQEKHNFLLTKTDREISREIEKIVHLVGPYLNRSKTERTNILLQVRSIIEKQIKFINENTTYYGRTLFYEILSKWKKEVDETLEEKISQSFPNLEVTIDPPYFIETEGAIIIQFLIKNSGETTSEGFFIHMKIESTIYEDTYTEVSHEESVNIPSGDLFVINVNVPADVLEDSNAVEAFVKIQPIYQSKKLPVQEFQFTIEKEPDSRLEYEDIPWKDGPIPPEYLFKGRKGLISDLAQHYLSTNRDKPYILYGLTRTGKSSILKYLKENIENDQILVDGQKYKIITFEWNLQEISNNSNAREFYTDILIEKGYNRIREKLIAENKWDGSFKVDSDGRFRDFRRILEFLKDNGYFPFFMLDEFSYIKDLMDRQTIGPGFLASLREYSLTGLASFIFAGTYDIKDLISDKKYGITGQLVHTIEYQVDSINPNSAEELISVIDRELSFTPEAIKHIQHLSGNIPYFIQIICKSCGDYAVENKRRNIGYPELEKVVKVLIGEIELPKSLVQRLPAGKFQNNQYSPLDPKEIGVLFTSIAHFNKNQIIPRGVGSHELEKVWVNKKITAYKSRLAKSLQILLEKKILKQEDDDGVPVYKFSVDIFRRWWYNHHRDINLELTTLIEE